MRLGVATTGAGGTGATAASDPSNPPIVPFATPPGTPPATPAAEAARSAASAPASSVLAASALVRTPGSRLSSVHTRLSAANSFRTAPAPQTTARRQASYASPEDPDNSRPEDEPAAAPASFSSLPSRSPPPSPV